jgi:hypothetical protein
VAALAALHASDVGKVRSEYGSTHDVRSDVLKSVLEKAVPVIFGGKRDMQDLPRDTEPWRSWRARLLDDPDAALHLSSS